MFPRIWLGLCLVMLSVPVHGAVWYVDGGAGGTGSGDSWGNAFTTLQAAADAAAADADDAIWVAAGTYTAAGDPVLTMKSGVDIYGGFLAGATQLSDQDWESNTTTIDGEFGRRCVIGADNALLDGFTLRRGSILGHGGGMLNDGVSPRVQHCVFSENTVSGTGMAGGRGGGVYVTNGAPVFADCTFSNNTTSSGGAGLYAFQATPEIHHCIFEGNEANPDYMGGGAFFSEAAAVIRNCIFYGNIAHSGCGLGTYKAAAQISNCLFAGNTAGASVNAGAGLFLNSDPAPTITNCVVWGNTPDDLYGAAAAISYSLIGGGYSGEGNLDADPKFLDLASGDLRFEGGSPCIDAGEDAVAIDALDLAGNPRIVGVVDMGAYEHKTSVRAVAPAAYAEAAADTLITATVNSDIAPITAASSIFKVDSASAPLQHERHLTLSYDDADPYVLTLTGNADFQPGAILHASVYADAVDLAPRQWRFRIGVAASSSGVFLDGGQALSTGANEGVVLGDLDDDGDLDAFIATNGAGNQVWINDGSGVFGDSGQSLGTGVSRDVALGDLDADGDLDAFVVNEGAGNTVWSNDGSGAFSDSGQSLGLAASRAVVLGDVEGDGDLDAFVVNDGAGDVIWINDGSGAFSDSGQSLGSAAGRDVAMGDVDLDGDWDFLVVNYGEADALWLNNSTGVLIDSGQSLGAGNTNACALEDLDGDGAPDLYCVNANAADTVWINDGAGHFTDSEQALDTGAGAALALGDFDGDGDVDAFVVNAAAADTLWLNDGAALFSDSGQALGTAAGRGVGIGDVIGNGSLDAFVVNTGEADVIWLNSAAPEVSTGAATEVDGNSAILHGSVDAEGGAGVTERGFYWDENPIDTADLTGVTQVIISPDPGGAGAFEASISGLSEGAVYYYVAYARNVIDTRYGAQVSFSSKETPVISWATPEAIGYGEVLSGTQLNASANVAGAFVYTPAAGSLLDAGLQTLNVIFTPTDTATYLVTSDSVTIQVNPATPAVTAWPTASALSYGQSLSSSTLSGGSASTPGSFAFSTPATTPAAGSYSAAVVFSPTDAVNYEAVSGSVEVSVSKATPTITSWPSAGGITYGEPLSEATLSGGNASVPGSFSYDAPWTTPPAGAYSAALSFTPNDTANYLTVGGNTAVAVAKASPTITAWPHGSAITVGQALSESTLSGGVALVAGLFAYADPGITPPLGSYMAAVTFTPTDTTNYVSVSGSVVVTVSESTPTIDAWPTASAIVYGQSLASSALSGGAASVPGTFAFENPGDTPNAGVYTAAVRFTPTDSVTYQPLSGTVHVTVEKAAAVVSLWPEASAISYGESLGDSILSGGASTPEGSFAFTNPLLQPNAGNYAAGVTFIPSDAANYSGSTGTVTVAVNKATPTVDTWPSATALTYGQRLDEATLSGGAASVAGAFSFSQPWLVPGAGSYSAALAFTPADTSNYTTVSGSTSVSISKATPTVNRWPTASAIEYGEALSASVLSGGVASVAGIFGFVDPETQPPVGANDAAVRFSPSDAANYNTVDSTVSVAVNKEAPVILSWPSAASIRYGQPLSASSLSGGEASVAGSFAFVDAGVAPEAGNYSAAVRFTPTNTDGYRSVEGSVVVVVAKAIPVVSAWPVASGITYGDTLSASTLSGGAASTAGAFDFSAPWTTPDAGLYEADVTFTPEDNDNYQAVSGSVDLSVSPAVAVIQLEDLTQVYDGSPKPVQVTTIPYGLTVTVLYDGASTPPVEIGEYAVTVEVDEVNYTGSASETLKIRTADPTEGEACLREYHSADQDQNNLIDLSELLRVVQFFNSHGLYCANPPSLTEDGYVPRVGSNHSCCPHAADYLPGPPDWAIELSELLRVIQFYNFDGYYFCPEDPLSEDTYCPGPPK